MDDKTELTKLIHRVIGVDLTNPATRRRAWRRIRVYREIADECEKDGNKRVAETLRTIYNSATRGAEEDEHTLIHLALLAGLEDTEEVK